MLAQMTTTPTAHVPSVPTDTKISLTVDHGAAVMAGTASAPDAMHAQRTVLDLPGVRGVAQEVEPWGGTQESDVRITRQVVRALSAAPDVPASVQAIIHRGQVVLRGEVETQRQREAACRAVDHIWGG